MAGKWNLMYQAVDKQIKEPNRTRALAAAALHKMVDVATEELTASELWTLEHLLDDPALFSKCALTQMNSHMMKALPSPLPPQQEVWAPPTPEAPNEKASEAPDGVTSVPETQEEAGSTQPAQKERQLRSLWKAISIRRKKGLQVTDKMMDDVRRLKKELLGKRRSI